MSQMYVSALFSWAAWRSATDGDVPERDAAERFHHVLALMVLVTIVVYAVGVPFVFVKKAAPAVLCGIDSAVAVACLLLVRRGHVRLGCWTLLAFSWLLVTVAAVFARGVTSVIAVFFLVLAVGAGWLLGRRAMLLISGASCLAAVVLTIVDVAGGGLPNLFPMGQGSSLLLFLLAMMLVSAPFLEVLRSLHLARDKSESQERQAAAALRDAEARLRALLDASLNAKFLVDIGTGMIVYANPAAETLSGRSLAELQSMHHTQLHPEEKAAAARRGFEADAMLPGLTQSHVVHKDGHAIPVEIVSSHVAGVDGRPMLLGVFLDVTERNRAQEALRQSEERLRQIAESSSDFIWEVDPEGLCLYLSPVVEQVLGYTPQEMVGRMHFYDLCPPDQREEFRQGTLEIFARRESFRNLPNWSVRKDGKIVALEATGTPILDAEGKLVGYRGVVTDVTERKQAEAALREREAILRTITESTPDPIFVKDRASRLLLANPATLAALQKTAGEVLGRTDEEIYDDPEVGRQMIANDREVMECGGTCVMEEVVPGAGGARTFLSTKTPYRDAQGDIIGVIVVARDITDRKLAEERLRASEIRLKDAQRLAKVGCWEVDLGNDRIQCSDEMFRIHGLKNSVPLTFPAVLSYVHPKDRETVVEVDSTVRSRGGPVEAEYRIIRPGGEVRFVRSIVESIRNDAGMPVRIVGATQDITEQVLTREFLRESEERLKNAERLAHVGNWRWDLKTQRRFWSDEIVRICGYPQGTPLDHQAFLKLIAPADEERVHQWINHWLAGVSRPIEFQIVRPDGEMRTVSCRAEVTIDDQGPAHVSGTCQDITDYRRAENEALARQKLESIGTLANGIAHDFNNLLGGVLAHADLALSEIAEGISPEDQLKGIQSVAVRGSEIVRQLMIYAGKENDIVELVDFSCMVEEMLTLLRVSASKHAVVETELAKDLPPLRANAAQLRQVVMNLVTNASEAIGDRGGTIRVRTKRVSIGVDSPPMESELLAEGEYVQLEVADTGCGMPPEIRGRVFDPFFTTKAAGHGLGLAVVEGIVRGLHGAIHVESDPGRGTTFRILLPGADTADESGPAVVDPTWRTAPFSREATILVVEDEDSLRQPVSKMMRHAGLTVMEASDGTAALEMIRARQRQIDVLLLDFTLPGSPSSEVLAEAKRLRPGMKVIVTSAYNKEMVTASLAGSVEGFIRKPYEIKQLVTLLHEMIS